MIVVACRRTRFLAKERGSDVSRYQVDAEPTLPPCERAETDMYPARQGFLSIHSPCITIPYCMDAWIRPNSFVPGGMIAFLLIGGCAEHERLNMLLDATPEQLVTEIHTPREAAEIIDMRMKAKADPKMGRSDTWQSLSTTLTLESGDCDDWAVASAALLADDGWSARLLIVGTVRVFLNTQNQIARRGYCHAVHLLERDGLYGANGINSGDRIEPQFATIEELVRRLPLIQDRWDFYKVVSLEGVDIVDGPGNLFDRLADRYKTAQWIDVKYPSKPTSQLASQ